MRSDNLYNIRLLELAQYLHDQIDHANQAFQLVKLKASMENPFFTMREIDRMVHQIQANYLNPVKLNNWFSSFPEKNNEKELVVGIIAAGNIPLVSFHDIWCCLAMGCKIKLKPSSKDRVLIEFVVDKINLFYQNEIQPIELVDTLKDYSAVIATGGVQASNLFSTYFSKYPSVIRGHRNSVAILTGRETEQDLKNLGDDVFSYFGLGCRNVHHLLVPEFYNFNELLDCFDRHFLYIRESQKYSNNYDYYLASYLLGRVNFFQAESILLVENSKLNPPIASLYFTRYKNEEHFMELLQTWSSHIQCICCQDTKLKLEMIPFGTSQWPSLHDYQDKVNTIEFLATLSNGH